MPKKLVIVESPAKAKTIEGYLGSDFKVTSSYGHVRDLKKGDKAIDIENGFKPTYVVSSDKKDVIKELKKLVRDAETVYLASDDDREGEAISWHLKEVLDLDDSKARRIVFREITKNAILNALQNPRGIDHDLVNAQQARRILDRLVGFELSPILWKKIKTGLSAGRVQSVAVRLVVERERDIDKFEVKSSYKVTATFLLDQGKELAADLSTRFTTEEEALSFLEKCKGAEFSIKNLEKKPAKKSPAPPFTTSTLQQEASRKLGFSVAQTMTLAQKLYENGKISYMRTDSLNLSDDAVAGASAEIRSAFGDKYLKTRKFKTKSKSAQEAHEAIRPTDFSAKEAGNDRNEKRLYELIWKRAIASQMAEASLEKTIATIDVSTVEQDFIASGEVITFDGFLKVYIESTDDEIQDEENKGMLPPLAIGQMLDLDHIRARQGFSRPPARFTEASLVKHLEEMGIGRPSTYAPTISTIQKRGYVEKESRPGKERKYKELILKDGTIQSMEKEEIAGTEKNKLFPTNTAMVVNDFLVTHFPDVTDYSFTAEVEKELDDIAEGNFSWDNMIDVFYGKFHPKVESTENIERSQVGSSREIGVDPASGKKVYAKLGKFGPYVQIGENDDDPKPRYASLRTGQFIESIKIEEALELFKLPREIGEFEGEMMIAAIGKFGPYIRHNGKFYSIGKDQDPLSISEEEAVELIHAKRKADAEKFIKVFEENPEVQVLKGRYGPYIKVGKKNVKIPKGKEPEDLTLEECLELAEKAPARGKRAARKK
ncbi:MAG: type I DNA topoisomerase [Cytophagales bacterium]|nr:type I DNA topoisomerase [Cytophagales bacterium]